MESQQITPKHFICKTCGKDFITKDKRQKFCSPACFYATKKNRSTQRKCATCGNLFISSYAKYCSQNCYHQSHAGHSKIPFKDSEVAQLYLKGLGFKPLVKIFRAHTNTLKEALLREGVKIRPPSRAIHIRRGPEKINWKGDSASYGAFHKRVVSLRGKPQYCEVCGDTSPGFRIKYQWANLTGHYENVNDYQRMCQKCHYDFDKKRGIGPHAFWKRKKNGRFDKQFLLFNQ